MCIRAARYGQSEGKGAALAERAFGLDATSVRLYYVASDSQPQPAPAATAASNPPASTNTQAAWLIEIGFRPRAIHFIKALKDARQVFGWNAGSGIAHEKALRISPALEIGTDDHRAARRGKLNGIVQQIYQHASDLLAIGGYQRLALLNLGTQLDAVTLRLGQHARHNFAHQQFRFNRLDAHGCLTRFNAREVK